MGEARERLDWSTIDDEADDGCGIDDGESDKLICAPVLSHGRTFGLKGPRGTSVSPSSLLL